MIFRPYDRLPDHHDFQTFLMDYLQLTETERFMVGHQLRDLVYSFEYNLLITDWQIIIDKIVERLLGDLVLMRHHLEISS